MKLGFICCFLGIVGLLRVEKLVDANYSRGWDDCLEAVCLIMAKAQSIEEAKKMFLDDHYNNLSIEGIAKNAGFRSKSTFNQVFKTLTGMTPTEFATRNGKIRA